MGLKRQRVVVSKHSSPSRWTADQDLDSTYGLN